MGLSVHDVMTCSPEAIEAVATAWERLSTAMVGDEAVVRNQVMAPLSDGGWISKDGRRAVELIGFVAAQLEGARAESGAMVSILRQAALELRAAKESLLSVVKEIDMDASMSLGPNGKVTWTAPSPETAESIKATAEGYATLIDSALLRATEADLMAASAIRANTDAGVKLDFNAHALGADPVADAIRLKDLYAKLQNGKELSPEEMQHVRLLLSENQWDPAFQLTLMQQMGPEGLLAVTAATDSATMVPNMSQADREAIRFSLATALAGSSRQLAWDDTWMTDLAKAGGSRTATTTYGKGGETIWGYESLNSLLRIGNYDPVFLVRAGDDLFTFEKGPGNNGRLWQTDSPEKDPVTGLLIAMRKSPETASIFFDGPAAAERLDHLTQRGTNNDHAQPHMATLGQLLVAATPAQATHESVGILGTVTNYFGANPPKDIPGGLQPAIAQMLTSNIESVHVGLTAVGLPHAEELPTPLSGPLAAFENGALHRTLAGLESDQVGQIAKAEDVFAFAGLTIMRDHPSANPVGDYTLFINDYAQAQGALAQVPAQATIDEIAQEQKANGHWIQKTSEVVGTTVGSIPIAGPWAENGVNWLTEALIGNVDAAAEEETAQQTSAFYDAAMYEPIRTFTAWLDENGMEHHSAVITADMEDKFMAGKEAFNRSTGQQ